MLVATIPTEDFYLTDRTMKACGKVQEPKCENPAEEGIEIQKPGPHDVLLGRGGGTNNHEGNVLFRQLVNDHKVRYLACNKVDKPKVARDVVALWRKQDPPGRFLCRKDETKRGPGSIKDDSNIWIEVGDKKAREKASQCLRERTPDVLPYLSRLRQHQDQMTEQGVAFVEQQLSMNRAANGGSSLNAGLLDIPERSTSAVLNARRGSLPAIAHSASFGMPGLRAHDRRTSMPTVNRLQGQELLSPDQLVAQHHQVLQQAYTAIERSNDMNGMSLMQQNMNGFDESVLEMQQYQIMRNQMLLQEQERQLMRQSSLTMHAGAPAPHPVFSESPMAASTSARAQQLARQQQLLAQEHQRLVAERDHLLRQEQLVARRNAELERQQMLVQQQHLAAQMKQQARLSPVGLQGQSPSPTGPMNVPLRFDGDAASNIDPLPYATDELTPQTMSLAAAPPSLGPRMVTPDCQSGIKISPGGASTKRAGRSPQNSSKKYVKNTEAVSSTTSKQNNNDDTKAAMLQNKTTEKADLKVEKNSKPGLMLSPAKSKMSVGEETFGSHSARLDMDEIVTAMENAAESKLGKQSYQKNVERYISNHKIATHNLDFDAESENGAEIAVEGIDTTEWIKEALNDSGDFSFTQKRRVRRNSKFSDMSLTSSIEDMSVALSDMEQSHEMGSLRERRMSGNQSIMSELTDFDELDGL